MKVYELINLLGEAPANKEIKISACLTLSELMSGESIDKDCYMITLDPDGFDCDSDIGTIDTILKR